MEAIFFSVSLAILLFSSAFFLARAQKWAEAGKTTPSTTPAQTGWNEDQLIVVNALELSKSQRYRKDDTLFISTDRSASGKTLVFSVVIWWPSFEDLDTRKVTVFNVKPVGKYVNVNGTIEL